MTSERSRDAYFSSPVAKNGVDCWEVSPWSPNKILPEALSPKQTENEFLISPAFASKLGTEMAPGPNPIRPSGAAPSK